MSGLEIGALIAGTIGAAAGSVSAYKDAKEKNSGAIYKSTETMQYGHVVQQTQKICATSGGGNAGIKSNGDMYASSTTGGQATAIYRVDRQAWNSQRKR